MKKRKVELQNCTTPGDTAVSVVVHMSIQPFNLSTNTFKVSIFQESNALFNNSCSSELLTLGTEKDTVEGKHLTCSKKETLKVL